MHRMLIVVAVLATIVIGTSASQAQYSSQQIGAVSYTHLTLPTIYSV